MSPVTLNLQKSSQSLKLCLEKKGITQPPVIDVGFAVDVSGSFEDEHESGMTNDLLTRLAPWGLAFDPDKKVDVFTFSHGTHSAHYVGPLTDSNYKGFVHRQIIGKVPGWCGATDYAPVLRKMMEHFGWGTTASAGGFLGRIFGKKQEVVRKRSVIFFITDGENEDKSETRALLHAAQAQKHEVYVMFLGVSNNSDKFDFIRELGEELDNTGFLAIKDLEGFVQLSDEDVNEMLLVPELLEWLKK